MNAIVLVLQIITVVFSVISVIVNVLISNSQLYKQNFIKVETEQWKELYKKNLLALSKVYALTSPDIANDEVQASIKEALYYSAELKFTLKEIYYEEAELISVMEDIIKLSIQNLKSSSKKTCRELKMAREKFYFLGTIYDKANLEFILSQAKGRRFNSLDFIKIYNRVRRRFELNRDIILGTKKIKKELENDAKKLRKEVFVVEQKIPEYIEFANNEEEFSHFMLFIKDKLICYAKIKITEMEFTIERLAVIKEKRQKGYGRAMIEWCEREALANGCVRIRINSPSHAIEFYRKFGYKVYGRSYFKSKIKYKKMIKALVTSLDINID
jgi:predicted GNAT family N-acyltransferase